MGHPQITPMFYYYPNLAKNITNLIEQFHIGDALLAAPVLQPRQTHVK